MFFFASFLIGNLTYNSSLALLLAPISVILVLILIIALFYWAPRLALLLLCGYLGLALMHRYHEQYQHFGHELVGQQGLRTFVVQSKALGARGWRYEITLPGRWTLNPNKVVLFTPEQELFPGAHYQACLRFKANKGHHNFVGFNGLAHAFSKNIVATAQFCPKEPKLKLLDEPSFFNKAREAFKLQLNELLAPGSARALINALVFGDRQYLCTETQTLYQNTGTAHLLAISGLHLGVVMGFCYNLLYPLAWLVLRHKQRWRLKIVIAPLVILSGFGYCALAGFGTAAVRAWLMGTALLLAWCCKARVSFATVLLACGSLTVLIWPQEIYGLSFWLSYSAVALVFWLSRSQGKSSNKRFSFVTSNFLIWLFMLPFIVLFFGQFSFVAPLANMVAVPLTSFLVVPVLFCASLLLSVPSVSAPLLYFVTWLLNIQEWLLTKLVGLPWLLHEAPVYTGSQKALLLVFGVLALLPKGFWGRSLLLGLGPVLLFWPAYKGLCRGDFSVTMLDVGQGLAVLVQTKNYDLLYDTGPGDNNYDLSASVLMPNLYYLGTKSLDTIIVSHNDQDHIGGLAHLIDSMPPKRLLGSQAIDGFDFEICHAGQVWHQDGVRFALLAPELEQKGLAKRNDLSCVLEVSNSTHRVLLPGDITSRVEHKLLPTIQPVSVLLSPHHGSKTSSSPDFLTKLAPEIVLISSGLNNQYHHPHPSVVARMAKLGIQSYNSATNGAVHIVLPEQGDLTLKSVK